MSIPFGKSLLSNYDKEQMRNTSKKKDQFAKTPALGQGLLLLVLLCLALQQFENYSESIFLEQIELQSQSDSDADNNKQDKELKLDSDKYFADSKTINLISTIQHSTNLTVDKTYSSVIIEHIDPPPEGHF
ncbi:MAG: hypothetical protein Sapg2KO_39520 [Saprospiraceae bacterium]|mgnify:CR=1 FL=1